ncbi:MAG: GNAT family N-acetyltransferase [Hyphomicrobiales bacterium]
MADNELLHLAPGKIANVITYLQIVGKPDWTQTRSSHPGLILIQNRAFDLDQYRALFREVGEKWLWSSRLRSDDVQLSIQIHAANVELFEVMFEGAVVGMVELCRHSPENIELSFFGLKPQFTGKGLGRDLMQLTLNHAWTAETRKLWLHTCTFDHPAALKFYQACGFRPTGFAVEIMDDPRLLGLLPKTAGAHIPLLTPDTA